MQRYFDHTIDDNHSEPIDILGWPCTFRATWRGPLQAVDIDRLNRIVEAAKEHGVAIEINNTARSPRRVYHHGEAGGIKIHVWPDTRTHHGTTRYALRREKCGLTQSDSLSRNERCKALTRTGGEFTSYFKKYSKRHRLFGWTSCLVNGPGDCSLPPYARTPIVC